MSGLDIGLLPPAGAAHAHADERLLAVVDERTRGILERRRHKPVRRGWLVRRVLLVADVAGLAVAFVIAEALSPGTVFGLGDPGLELLLLLATLPFWVVAAKLHGLYDRDEERADHSTVNEISGVLQLVTLGVWSLALVGWAAGFTEAPFPGLAIFWLSAVTAMAAGRSAARAFGRRSLTYLQNTVIVGAGDVGQLVARKLRHHPEYGINLVGFIDPNPKEQRADLVGLTLLGRLDELPWIVELLDVERVIVAFSNEREEEIVSLIRLCADADVQVDIVPRLFELVGPRATVHTVEGLPLVGLPPVRPARSSRLLKRWIDIVGALVGIALAAPLFVYAAIRIKLDSPGPVFFRQTRLGFGMREFTALKFRTMHVETDEAEHREFIGRVMSPEATLGSNGLYKLDRVDAVTRFGRWLRETSLDELPQLINVLRGEMSLVGPRPCIPYEIENFAQHHFERFSVPAGVTGLWQVTARAKSTFGEALDMDVAYVRGWSLGLDLQLLFRTPVALLRSRATA